MVHVAVLSNTIIAVNLITLLLPNRDVRKGEGDDYCREFEKYLPWFPFESFQL